MTIKIELRSIDTFHSRVWATALAGFRLGIERASPSGVFNFLRVISQVLAFQVPRTRCVVCFSLLGQPGCLCTGVRLKNHSEVGDGQQDLRVY